MKYVLMGAAALALASCGQIKDLEEQVAFIARQNGNGTS